MVLIAIVVYGGTGLVHVVRASGAGHDHTVFSAQLPNVPGKTLTAIVVEYGPGGISAAHRHAGSVFAYVLSEQIRSEKSATGPVRVYRAGGPSLSPPAALTWSVQCE
jgi:quercetin dioxygenase-like cupin family protein